MSQKVFPQVLQQAAELLGSDGRVALCQIVRTEGSTPGKPGWKMLVRANGESVGNLGGGAFEALVATDAGLKLTENWPGAELKRYYFTEKAVRGEPTGMVCGGMAEVFLEVMMSAPVLVVCGGGPVGQALAVAGELADFEVLVVEDRPEFLEPSLYGEAVLRQPTDRRYSGDFLDRVKNRDLHVAIVTRCWETDTAALAGVLRQAPANLCYLGLMGSRRKIERVKQEVVAAGHSLDGVELHAPIGLPIGGDSPGEIAISILAEVLQAKRAEKAPEEPAEQAVLEEVS